MKDFLADDFLNLKDELLEVKKSSEKNTVADEDLFGLDSCLVDPEGEFIETGADALGLDFDGPELVEIDEDSFQSPFPKGFYPLHNYTEHSIGLGFSKISELITSAKNHGLDALGVVERATCSGMYDFVVRARKNDMVPIPAVMFNVADKSLGFESKDITSYTLILIPKNEKGLNNIFTLNYLSSLPENKVDDIRYTDIGMIEMYKDNLIAITGDEESKLTSLLIGKKKEQAKEELSKLKELFGEDLYVEIRSTEKHRSVPWQDLITLSEELDVKCFLSPKSYYAKAEHLDAINTLTADLDYKKMHETASYAGGTRRAIEDGDLGTFLDPRTIETIMSHDLIEPSIVALKEIKNKVDISFEFDINLRPRLKDCDPDETYPILVDHIKRGLKKKRGDEGVESIKASLERTQMELEVLKSNDFLDYFLVVEDYSRYSSENGIIRGVGRGSAAGTEIAYLLDITDVDPIKYDLLFERFLSPGRGATYRVSFKDGTEEEHSVSDSYETARGKKYTYQLEEGDIINGKEVAGAELLIPGGAPDIDMDFPKYRRHEVIEYVTEKYGADSVAGIITYSTMLAKGALKVAMSAFGVPFSVSNRLTKNYLPSDLGLTIADIRALKDDPTNDFWSYGKEHAVAVIDGVTYDIDDFVDIAENLEGRMRGTGVHACAIIISPRPLLEVVPCVVADNGDTIIEWSAKICENLGLVKMDFLGLELLDTLDLCCDYIKQNKDIDIEPKSMLDDKMDDAKTFELFRSGNTTGVFQYTEEGVQGFLRELQPQNFEDLYAVTAIYRPGPMGMKAHETYAKRRRGEEAPIPLNEPKLLGTKIEEALKPTAGLIIFQEQLMSLAGDVAGFSDYDKDQLRKATAKKNDELLQELGPRLMDGIAKEVNKDRKPGDKNYLTKEDLDRIWEQILGFSSYSFNKSHSVAYATMGYQAAFLKAHFPVEFMAASMSVKSDDSKKLKPIIKEALRMGLRVLAPDINYSESMTVPRGDDILAGFALLKGVSTVTGDIIVEERNKGGKFQSLEDFAKRMYDTPVANKGTITPLVYTGAFDSFGSTRQDTYKELMGLFARYKKQRNMPSGGLPLFFAKPETISLPKDERLGYEYKYMGIYLSGHPLDDMPMRYDVEEEVTQTRYYEPGGANDFGEVLNFYGVVNEIEKKISKNNTPYVVLSLDTGNREDCMFSTTVFYNPEDPNDKMTEKVKSLEEGACYAFFSKRGRNGNRYINDIELMKAPPKLA